MCICICKHMCVCVCVWGGGVCVYQKILLSHSLKMALEKKVKHVAINPLTLWRRSFFLNFCTPCI
jgi:hypothetical protein